MSEKFITPCELPTAYERELLTILIEECAEVQQRATKLLRFGRDDVQSGQMYANAERLGSEIGDLQVMIELVAQAGLASESSMASGRGHKRKQLAKYMQTGVA